MVRRRHHRLILQRASDVAERADRLGGIFQERLLEGRIGPGASDDHGAITRADLGLVGLDDGVERGRVDVALLGQHRLQRPHPQLHLRQFGAMLVVVIVVMVVVVVIVIGHGNLQRIVLSSATSPMRCG